MNIPSQWATAYWASNGVAVLLLLLAWIKPGASRGLFAFIFLGASVVNARLALVRPEEYLNYADFAVVETYRQFILGYFADHITTIVLLIALGQAIVGALLLRRSTVQLGALGACVFLLAIAPLGVGSAFPFSLICCVALARVAWDGLQRTEQGSCGKLSEPSGGLS